MSSQYRKASNDMIHKFGTRLDEELDRRPSTKLSYSNGQIDRNGHRNQLGGDIGPDLKLSTALDDIRSAYSDRVLQLQSEIAGLKQVNEEQDRTIHNLENNIDHLQNDIQKRSEEFHELDIKHNDLIKTQKHLVNKYNLLRRYAAQLEAFKKKIITVSGSGPNPMDSDVIEQSLAIEDEKVVSRKHPQIEEEDFKGIQQFDYLSEPVFGANESNFTTGQSRDNKESDRILNQNLDNKFTFRGRDPLPVKEPSTKSGGRGPISNTEINGSESNLGGPRTNSRHSSYRNPTSYQRQPSKDEFFDLDEPFTQLQKPSAQTLSLYSRISQSLHDESKFDEFKRIILNYNNQRFDLSDTLKSLHHLIPSSQLYNEMKNLLLADHQKKQESDNSYHPSINLASDIDVSY